MCSTVGPMLGDVANPDTSQTVQQEVARRILLADDCVAARLLTAALIRKMGVEVHTAANGEEALIKAKAGDYDMVILDLDMPVLDGIATARSLRAAIKRPQRRLLIVAMSGFIESFADVDREENLFDATISKPVTRQRLLDTILGLLRPSTSLMDRFAGHHDQYHDLPLLNLNDINAMQSETDSEVWCHFVNEAIQQLRQIATQIDHALSIDDNELLRTQGLSMQGISMLNAAPQLSRRVSAFEHGAKNLPTPALREQTRHLVGCLLATVTQLKKLSY